MISALIAPSLPCASLLLYERAHHDLRGKVESDRHTHEHNIQLSNLLPNPLRPVSLRDLFVEMWDLVEAKHEVSLSGRESNTS
jgi:hypothetical protein